MAVGGRIFFTSRTLTERERKVPLFSILPNQLSGRLNRLSPHIAPPLTASIISLQLSWGFAHGLPGTLLVSLRKIVSICSGIVFSVVRSVTSTAMPQFGTPIRLGMIVFFVATDMPIGTSAPRL
jgi:hypothetical protein